MLRDVLARLRCGFGLLLAAALAAAMPAAAQAPFPTRPAQLLVGLPPGGGTDLIARSLQGPLGTALGQTVVVRNVTGAAGTIAGQQVATAPPDGYLAIIAPVGVGGVILPHLRDMPYRLEDFRAVCAVYDGPVALMVAPDGPIRDLPSLIRMIRERPGSVNYASPGVGSAAHVIAAGFARALGLELEHVPFRGAAEIALAMRAGQIQLYVDSFNVSTQLDLRPIAAFRDSPLVLAPQLPLMRDVGFPGDYSIHGGIFLPRGVPEAVFMRWQSACRAGIEAPETQDAFRRMSVLPMFLEGAAYMERLMRERDLFRDIVRATGIPRLD